MAESLAKSTAIHSDQIACTPIDIVSHDAQEAWGVLHIQITLRSEMFRFRLIDTIVGILTVKVILLFFGLWYLD